MIYLFASETVKGKAFENILGNEENAGKQVFSALPIMFSTISKVNIII